MEIAASGAIHTHLFKMVDRMRPAGYATNSDDSHEGVGAHEFCADWVEIVWGRGYPDENIIVVLWEILLIQKSSVLQGLVLQYLLSGKNKFLIYELPLVHIHDRVKKQSVNDGVLRSKLFELLIEFDTVIPVEPVFHVSVHNHSGIVHIMEIMLRLHHREILVDLGACVIGPDFAISRLLFFDVPCPSLVDDSFFNLFVHVLH